jgi:flagellar brake protein
MFSDTRVVTQEPAEDPSLADFRISEPVEIRALLKELMDRSVMVNLCAPDGSSYVSTLWSVDAERQKISFSADLMAPTVQRLVEAEEAAAVCYMDHIKIQFDVMDRVLVRGQQNCVLQAQLPREVYRFQRRAAFRVRPLDRTAPTATFRHPQVADMRISLRVLDVSMGGCALFLPNDVPVVDPGLLLNGVQVALDGDTQFQVSLTVQHVTAILPDSAGVRLGCEFGRMDTETARMLQLYIDGTQKRRRMMVQDSGA